MRPYIAFLAVCLALNGAACAESDGPEPPFQDGVDLVVNGTPWLRTITPVFDRANADHTYKVFTHVYDFEGTGPITKGPGGLYTHHRGLFIGWTDTMADGVDYDTWSMSNTYQQHTAWLAHGVDGAAVFQREAVSWRDLEDKPIIEEVRTITAAPGADGLRIVDFVSRLTSLRGVIELKGNVQHAGMHVRMAQEVADHQDTTQYILPEGAQAEANEQATGAWWVCARVIVRGEQYWVLHMTPPDHPAGQPVYSIRNYARFGAYTEPTLQPGQPLELRYRVVFAKRELDRAACEALYRAYAEPAK